MLHESDNSNEMKKMFDYKLMQGGRIDSVAN